MKISVMVAAYNHEHYIAQAIQSVLDQKFSQDFEIVIGEDKSTDSTRDIVRDFAYQYPDLIRPCYSDQNLGASRNYIRTLNHCRGEYIAVLDGDDYWTDPFKLEKQIAFMEDHPECALCFHNALVKYEGFSKPSHPYIRRELNQLLTLKDLIQSNFIPFCTALYKNHGFADIPDWYYKIAVDDFPLHIFSAKEGFIGYINETMATYRVHAGGAWSGTRFENHLLADIEFYERLWTYLTPDYQEVIKKAEDKRWEGLAETWREEALSLGNVDAGILLIHGKSEEISSSVKTRGKWKSRLLSATYMDYAFKCFRSHDYVTARKCVIEGVRLHPAWLLNRGVLSISRKLVGDKMWSSIRRIQ